MFQKMLVLVLFGLLVVVGCSPSQDQVNKAIQTEMEKRADEKKRIFTYIDEYIKERGSLPLARSGDSLEKSILEQIKNPKKIEMGESPTRGYKNAKVTLVVFNDFQCPFCAKTDAVVESILQKYPGRVRVVFKHFPIVNLHPEAKLAAQAAVVAQRQGKFWEMHDKLFQNQTALKKENLYDYAKQVGLDSQKFQKELEDLKAVQRVDQEIKQALQVGFTGAPSFLINGVELTGTVTEESLTSVIEVILKN